MKPFLLALALDTCKGLDQKVGASVRHSSGEVRPVLAADGAQGSDKDEACATASLEKARNRLD